MLANERCSRADDLDVRRQSRCGTGGTGGPEGRLARGLSGREDVGAGEGWILTNPPYGVRVGESKDLRDLYATLGTALKTKRGWRLGILTSDAVLAGQMRVAIRARFNSRNGGIPVSFLVSEKLETAGVRSPKPAVGGSVGGQ